MKAHHAHCPDCGSFLVTCNVCERTFVVQNVGVGRDFTRAELMSHEERAQNAAVWHIYDEHRDTWIETIGDRAPVNERLFTAVA